MFLGKEILPFVLDSTQSAIWEWNLKDNQVSYSDGWRRLFGYDSDEDLSWSTLIHPDQIFDTMSSLLQFSQGELSAYQSEHKLRKGDGQWCWVRENVCIAERDENNQAVRLIGLVRIIDREYALKQKQQELENRLSQIMKMESIGHLTAGIAHDFNNLLAGMLGYTELCLELIDDPLEKEMIKEYLNQVISAGNRAKELTRQMLVFSRAGKEKDKEAPVSLLQPILKEVIHLARSSISSAIEISYKLDNANSQARIHPVNLHQILLNLIVNARDAIDGFGRIEVSQYDMQGTHQCDVCGEEINGKFQVISVRDSGKGIPADILKNIFEPFFTTKETDKGTGMGLSVVQDLVHAHQGHISVDTVDGEGTTFRIYLPAIETTEEVIGINQDNKSSSKARACLDGLRVMVVDDEVAISNMMSEMLGMYGVKVAAYTRPDKALDEFIHHPDEYDILITDATMPGISGMELSRAILQLRPDFPILMCTGYSNQINKESAQESGIAGFMQKPLELPRLIEWIEGHS